MQRALVWVILIVTLSLACIAALNYWTHPNSSFRSRTDTTNSPIEIALAGPIAVTRQAVYDTYPPRKNLELEVHIVKSYPSMQLDVAFTAGNGALGLLGPSGSGKTMTLRCIAGLDTPDSGSIILNGRVLFDAKRGTSLPPARRRVGVVFQAMPFSHI
jgi:molybdate transport system permease protein